MGTMKANIGPSVVLALFLGLLAANGAQAQVSYCKQIGNNKTWCNNGMLIHQFGHTTVIPDVAPLVPRAPVAPPAGGLLRNNDLPTLAVPYAPAGTQNRLSGYGTPLLPPPTQAAPAPVLVVPAAGARVCHQFGTTLICN